MESTPGKLERKLAKVKAKREKVDAKVKKVEDALGLEYSVPEAVAAATADTAGGGTALVWTGDRWQQSPDGLKGHDPQTWLPLAFDDDGALRPIEWLDSFTLDVV